MRSSGTSRTLDPTSPECDAFLLRCIYGSDFSNQGEGISLSLFSRIQKHQDDQHFQSFVSLSTMSSTRCVGKGAYILGRGMTNRGTTQSLLDLAKGSRIFCNTLQAKERQRRGSRPGFSSRLSQGHIGPHGAGMCCSLRSMPGDGIRSARALARASFQALAGRVAAGSWVTRMFFQAPISCSS